MFKKYSQLVIGFVLGASLFSLTPVKAAIEEYVLQKADYKVEILGKEYTDSENPILTKDGVTYGPLRSMLSAAGLSINWDAEKGVASVAKATSAPLPTSAPTPTPKTDYTFTAEAPTEYNNVCFKLTLNRPVDDNASINFKVISLDNNPVAYKGYSAWVYYNPDKKTEILINNMYSFKPGKYVIKMYINDVECAFNYTVEVK